MEKSILANNEDLQSIVSQRSFVSEGKSANQKVLRESLRAFVQDPAFEVLLKKVIKILTPIDGLIVKYQKDSVPISEIFNDLTFKLPEVYESMDIVREEKDYIKKTILGRWNFLWDDCHGIAYLLDPQYAGVNMDISLRTELEQFIFSWNLSGEVDEELRKAMEDEYKDFIRMSRENKRSNSKFYIRVSSGKLTPRDFWFDYSDSYDHLKELGRRIFSLTPSSASCERNFSKVGFIHFKLRNKLGSEKEKMLAYIKNNYNQLYDQKNVLRLGGMMTRGHLSQALTGVVLSRTMMKLPMKPTPQGAKIWRVVGRLTVAVAV